MDQNDRPGLSRRKFIVATGATLALPVAGIQPLFAAQLDHFDLSTDVLVVGSGAAGGSAAVFAHQAGAQVTVIEKANFMGGTTRKSQGGYWIPNNSLMRAAGATDPRPGALRYMVRLSYPERYNPDHPTLGINPDEYGLIATFYDNAARVIDELAANGDLHSTFFPGFPGQLTMPDYYPTLAENEAPYGRALLPKTPSGAPAQGAEIARQFEQALKRRNIPLLLNHRARRLIMDNSGAVVGLEVGTNAEQVIRIKAKRGVIFATGGFIHNPELRRNFLRGPVFGGCTVTAAEGDFIPIAQAAGAQFGNMQQAWWAEVLLEQALQNSAVPMNIFVPTGDSMLQVNRLGKRYVDEKFVYNERSQLHFVWDPIRAEYTNLVTFTIYDQRTAELFAGQFPIPLGEADYVVSGQTLAELDSNLKARLQKLGPEIGGFSLDGNFAETLEATIKEYNQYATTGKDLAFGRGDSPTDQFFHLMFQPESIKNPSPNKTMYPLADKGPYHALLTCAGVLDTKGGPKIDSHGRILDSQGQAIPGLYGAGNCIASPAANAYWSAGGTIGPALTFGALAGSHAGRRG